MSRLSPQFFLLAAVIIGVLLLGTDITVWVVQWPRIPIELHNDVLAMAAVLAAGGLHGRTLRQGIMLGRDLERIALQMERQGVLPLRRRAAQR